MFESVAPVTTVPRTTSPASSLDALGDEIARLAERLSAGAARFLEMLAEFDLRRGWAADGMRSCAQWLSWRCEFAPITAREHVRVARALRDLPKVSSAFARGDLSYSKVRALTRLASSVPDDVLAEWGRCGTAAQLEEVVRNVRLAEADGDPRLQHARRSIRPRFDDDGSLELRARLAPEQGAVWMRAMQKAERLLTDERSVDVPAETLPVEGRENVPAETPSPDDDLMLDDLALPWERRRADAFTLVAESFLRGGLGREEAQPLLIVHVDPEALAGGIGGMSYLQDGPGLPLETLRRLACDAGIVRITEGPSGETVSVGRRTRVVPRRQRRLVRARDRTCRFPGCCARRADVHHIIHWADGGLTALSNLILLCRTHHRLIHERRFSLTLEANGDARFFRPDGRPIVTARDRQRDRQVVPLGA